MGQISDQKLRFIRTALEVGVTVAALATFLSAPVVFYLAPNAGWVRTAYKAAVVLFGLSLGVGVLALSQVVELVSSDAQKWWAVFFTNVHIFAFFGALLCVIAAVIMA